MLPWSADLTGRIEARTISSQLLRDNPLGDPPDRPIWVYLPPGYDEAEQRYPAVYVIQGYTGLLTMWSNRKAFRTPFPEAADALFARGDVPPCVVVFIDAWTAYGGSQFVDSIGTGRYHSYLCDEVVPWVDARYRTVADRESRAITGKSSGGFGAMITPMLRPDVFGALATHAGDALYEYCYLPEFARAARFLRDYDGDIWRWWADFGSRTAFTKPADAALLTALGCSAAFSPDDEGRPVLPFDPRSGVVRAEVWDRWLEWDPVRMVEAYVDPLLSMRAIWIDAGDNDDYFLDLGAQAFREELTGIGVPPERVHFEIFPGSHADIEYRYPMALAWLAERLARAV